jgi:hypothetical protein
MSISAASPWPGSNYYHSTRYAEERSAAEHESSIYCSREVETEMEVHLATPLLTARECPWRARLFEIEHCSP